MSIENLRQDCLAASAGQPEVRTRLGRQHLAVTGGTGFLGTWIAETVAALNDEYQLGITVDLYARNVTEWKRRYPHLAERSDIGTRAQDVRSPFDFSRNTNYVVHAAGVPNGRVHASDPLRVQQTTVMGINNALSAASQLDDLKRFVNVSSCLVNGMPNRPGPISETDSFAVPAGQLHNVYAEAKRAAESIASIYRSQFRIPVSTVRPFTFAGPYQELDRPWAVNSFLRDILTGGDVRIHGDGSARRSYLYGSDAAWWTLATLINGTDGGIYNLGSAEPVTHLELVDVLGGQIKARPRISLNTAPARQLPLDELYPDTRHAEEALGVTQTCRLPQTMSKTYEWFAHRQG